MGSHPTIDSNARPRARRWPNFGGQRVGTYAGTLLQILAGEAPPDTRQELAERAGYQVSSGSFSAAIAKLRKLGLIEGRGLRASAAFLTAIG